MVTLHISYHLQIHRFGSTLIICGSSNLTGWSAFPHCSKHYLYKTKVCCTSLLTFLQRHQTSWQTKSSTVSPDSTLPTPSPAGTPSWRLSSNSHLYGLLGSWPPQALLDFNPFLCSQTSAIAPLTSVYLRVLSLRVSTSRHNRISVNVCGINTLMIIFTDY